MVNCSQIFILKCQSGRSRFGTTVSMESIERNCPRGAKKTDKATHSHDCSYEAVVTPTGTSGAVSNAVDGGQCKLQYAVDQLICFHFSPHA